MKVNNYLKLMVLLIVFGTGFKLNAQTVDQKIEHNQMITNYDQVKQNQVQESQRAIQDPTFPGYTNAQDYEVQKAIWISNNPDAYRAAKTGVPANVIESSQTGRTLGITTYVISVPSGIALTEVGYYNSKLQNQSGVVNVYVDSNTNRATVTLKDEYATDILKEVFNITL
jgi:hypothetical protein